MKDAYHWVQVIIAVTVRHRSLDIPADVPPRLTALIQRCLSENAKEVRAAHSQHNVKIPLGSLFSNSNSISVILLHGVKLGSCKEVVSQQNPP